MPANGRKIPDEVLIEAIQKSRGMIEVAARALKISPQTFYQRRKSSKAFADALDRERAYTTDTAELALYRAITAGESWAVQFYLKTQARDRGYIERVDVEVRTRITDAARALAQQKGLDPDDIVARAEEIVRAAGA